MQATSDLEKFKCYIESRGVETGAWRGSVEGAVGTSVVEAAEETRGDSGKAGVSAKAVAAGAAAAAAGVAAATALNGKGDSAPTEDTWVGDVEAAPVAPVADLPEGRPDIHRGHRPHLHGPDRHRCRGAVPRWDKPRPRGALPLTA